MVAERVTMAPRLGPRPRTRLALPHEQLEQWPPAAIATELMTRILELPHVRQRQSRMASPDCRALCLPDTLAFGPREAFIDDHEFCHLHPLPQSSLHLTLPFEPRECAIDLGWAEQHPAARVGAVPEALVMVYAPRNAEELAVVLRLISCSYEFARWGAE
jgi:hypothetical protein